MTVVPRIFACSKELERSVACSEADWIWGGKRLQGLFMRLTEFVPVLLAVYCTLSHLAQHKVQHSLDTPE